MTVLRVRSASLPATNATVVFGCIGRDTYTSRWFICIMGVCVSPVVAV